MRNSHSAIITIGLVVAFVCAVGIRLLVGGAQVATSVLAGLVFAGCLIGVAAIGHPATDLSKKSFARGLVGGIVLCLPAFVARVFHGGFAGHANGYLMWAVVVSAVAVAEEYFLRGALYDAAASWLGVPAAIMVSAGLFALLHVGLYGWHVLLLDVLVGIYLGALRAWSGTWTVPGVAHTTADLLSWWIR